MAAWISLCTPAHRLPAQQAAPSPVICTKQQPAWPGSDADEADRAADAGRRNALLKTGALQNAILTSANFSIIATDEKGIIQLFNVGAERMLGYKAAEVVNRISPSDIHDPQEVRAPGR